MRPEKEEDGAIPTMRSRLSHLLAIWGLAGAPRRAGRLAPRPTGMGPCSALGQSVQELTQHLALSTDPMESQRRLLALFALLLL